MQISIQKESDNPRKYRDKPYMIKDLLSKLIEFGDVNQTALSSFCGLNITKHRKILGDLETNGLITMHKQNVGKRVTTMYCITAKGYDFCKSILNPFEEMFPRDMMNS